MHLQWMLPKTLIPELKCIYRNPHSVKQKTKNTKMKAKQKTHQKIIGLNKREAYQKSSSFNVLDYKFKNIVIGSFGSYWLGAI